MPLQAWTFVDHKHILQKGMTGIFLVNSIVVYVSIAHIIISRLGNRIIIVGSLGCGFLNYLSILNYFESVTSVPIGSSSISTYPMSSLLFLWKIYMVSFK